MATGFYCAISVCALAPAALGAMSPTNFWLRLVYASFALGAFLAMRRVALQVGAADVLPFDLVMALSAGAVGSYALSLGGPAARSMLRLAFVGLMAAIVGAAGAIGIVLLGSHDPEAASASTRAALAFAAAAALALPLPIAAAFAQRFAEGGSSASAAALAARDGAALALFTAVAGAAMAASHAIFARANVFEPAFVAFAVALVAVLGSIIATPASLALKSPDEGVAHAENLRQRAAEPFVGFLRAALSPSSALATIAVLAIAGIVTVFEAPLPPAPAEAFLIAVVTLAAAIIFVSIRTALLLAIMLALSLAFASGLHGFFPATTSAEPRLLAIAAVSVFLAPACLAWRDSRDPRRKAREVMMRAVTAGMPASALATVMGAMGLAAAASAGVFPPGGGAALFAAAMAAFSLVVSPAAMVSVSALFGRG